MELCHSKAPSFLKRCELKKLFTDESFEKANGDKVQRQKILKDDFVLDGDRGRSLVQFLLLGKWLDIHIFIYYLHLRISLQIASISMQCVAR